MHDDGALLAKLRQHTAARTPNANGQAHSDEPESDEGSCAAFGFLRGLNARATMLELRLCNGDTESFAYNLLGSVRYNPSVGLLLKFAGDVTTLVLVQGSNLDAELEGRAVNLTDRGLNRHRITWMREMDEDALAKTSKGQPTIDCIEIADFESPEEQRDWLTKVAPTFVRR